MSDLCGRALELRPSGLGFESLSAFPSLQIMKGKATPSKKQKAPTINKIVILLRPQRAFNHLDQLLGKFLFSKFDDGIVIIVDVDVVEMTFLSKVSVVQILLSRP